MSEDLSDALNRATLGLKSESEKYYSTNENLGSIIAGLNLQPTDNVLCIGGSGDQAFAALEYAHSVTAVDFMQDQIYLIYERQAALIDDDVQGFLLAWDDKSRFAGKRDDYFKADGRLDRIRSKLGQLDVADPANILDYLFNSPKDSFNKIYLSNIFGFFGLSKAIDISNVLSKIQGCVEPDSLIYVSADKEHVHEGKAYWEKDLPEGVVVDEELSNRAQAMESDWYPRVYRIVKNK